jgi:hypothetical protein
VGVGWIDSDSLASLANVMLVGATQYLASFPTYTRWWGKG